MKSFTRTKDLLSRALKGSVDSKLSSVLLEVIANTSSEHYQAFASSLPHHSSLLNHLGTAQQQMSDARASLVEAKEALVSKRADLVQLWTRAQTLEEMIKLLDQMCVIHLIDMLEL